MRIVAFTYMENRVHAFDTNLVFFTQVGVVHHPSSSQDFVAKLTEELEAVVSSSTAPRIAIDVSSFNRERLGSIVRVLGLLDPPKPVSVTFFYAMADFDSHEAEMRSTVLSNGPLEGFEGWTNDPGKPVACVIGLGFENVIALAALETLEPAQTIAFVSQSADSRYHARVLSDNATILGTPEVAVVPYTMEDPFSTLHSLEGVVHALRGTYRVALVPLGPKLFATLALLVAWEYQDSVAVWRVSADQADDVTDRIATGAMIQLSAEIDGRESDE